MVARSDSGQGRAHVPLLDLQVPLALMAFDAGILTDELVVKE
jgi:hypothetical protein